LEKKNILYISRMSESIIPESDNTEKFIFFVLVLLGIVIIFLEITGNNIPYSKFELKNERVNMLNTTDI